MTMDTDQVWTDQVWLPILLFSTQLKVTNMHLKILELLHSPKIFRTNSNSRVDIRAFNEKAPGY